MSPDIAEYLKLSKELISTPDTPKMFLRRWSLKVQMWALHRKIEGANG